MTRLRHALLAWALLLTAHAAHAERIVVAAAADLQFAMGEVVAMFQRDEPGHEVQVVYGSSGKFHSQIQQGAPYDLFFSADIALPRDLEQRGWAASAVRPYAVGRLVLWSAVMDARKLRLEDLTDPKITRVAIANPKHAPYGQRAVEALRAAGVWAQVAPKLVHGDNIAQAAQFAQTGNAQLGIIALSLALHPELARRGGHALIPAMLHAPLEQGFVVTRRAQANRLAQRFADFMGSTQARKVMARYGFELPNAPNHR